MAGNEHTAGVSIGLDASEFLGGSAKAQDEIERLVASFIHASREGDKTVASLAKSLSASPKEVTKALREMDKQDAEAGRIVARRQASAQKAARDRHRIEMRMLKERGQAVSNLRDSLLSLAEGVTVNLCEALSTIIETTHDLDIAVSWASTSPEREDGFKISFSSYDGECLKDAAKAITECDPRPNMVLQASVTDLHRDPEEKGSERITVKAKVDDKYVKINTKTDEDLYNKAVIAHQHNATVKIKGTLIKNGKKWVMENVEYIDTDPHLL